MKPRVVVLVSCCAGVVCMAQEFEITAIRKDGTITWAHPYTEGAFQVEWAVSPAGPWFTSWEELLDLVPDASGFLSVPVPACYRVGWVADGTGSDAADDGEAFANAGRDRDSGDVEVLPHATLGRLTWATVPGSTYRVEWASSSAGPWFTDWESLLGLTTPVVSAAAPVYYRVMCTGSCDPQMVYIPYGMFAMGDSFGEGGSAERPVHDVRISAFWMQRTEVTKAQWDEVKTWAAGHGYGFTMPGAGKGLDHPVQNIEWYDMVKWCNARSEKEGLTPCYYTSAAKTTVYKSGRLDIRNDWVQWDADGCRLPTEAEWEYAARGGAAGRRFPWSDSDTISHSRANYWAGYPYPYDDSYPAGYHPDYDTDPTPYTSPVGSFAPNGYGLYDMAGNVWEWCWDWYDRDYYSTSPGVDPRGPASGWIRVDRGGSWDLHAYFCRVAYRGSDWPDRSNYALGFRLVRSAP